MCFEVTDLFGGKEKMSTFAIPNEKGVPERVVVLQKTGAENDFRKFFEKSFEKIWKFKNKAYLCIPVRKTGLARGKEKFIEKTDLLYKKQVPRNTIYREALILLKEL